MGMGKVSMMSYSGPTEVLEELEAARRIYREGGFHVVDVTDKPIEIIADEIIKFISHNLDNPQRRPLPY
jgi:regulator of PEP synthase PpsR (kinase-PPPase family)